MSVSKLAEDRYLVYSGAIAGAGFSDAIGVEGWTQCQIEVYPTGVVGNVRVCAQASQDGNGTAAAWMPDVILDTTNAVANGNRLETPARENWVTWSQSSPYPVQVPVFGKWMRVAFDGASTNCSIIVSRMGNR